MNVAANVLQIAIRRYHRRLKAILKEVPNPRVLFIEIPRVCRTNTTQERCHSFVRNLIHKQMKMIWHETKRQELYIVM